MLYKLQLKEKNKQVNFYEPVFKLFLFFLILFSQFCFFVFLCCLFLFCHPYLKKIITISQWWIFIFGGKILGTVQSHAICYFQKGRTKVHQGGVKQHSSGVKHFLKGVEICPWMSYIQSVSKKVYSWEKVNKLISAQSLRKPLAEISSLTSCGLSDSKII